MLVNGKDVDNYTALRCIALGTQVAWSSVLIIRPLSLQAYRLNLQWINVIFSTVVHRRSRAPLFRGKNFCLSLNCPYHMTRTAPRAISLENHKKKGPV